MKHGAPGHGHASLPVPLAARRARGRHAGTADRTNPVRVNHVEPAVLVAGTRASKRPDAPLAKAASRRRRPPADAAADHKGRALNSADPGPIPCDACSPVIVRYGPASEPASPATSDACMLPSCGHPTPTGPCFARGAQDTLWAAFL